MEKFAVTTVTAGALAAAALGLAGAGGAAPAGPASATDTINGLQAQGYAVIVTKVGNAALDQCTVSALRPGVPISMLRPANSGNRHLVEQLQNNIIYVEASC